MLDNWYEFEMTDIWITNFTTILLKATVQNITKDKSRKKINTQV